MYALTESHCFIRDEDYPLGLYPEDPSLSLLIYPSPSISLFRSLSHPIPPLLLTGNLLKMMVPGCTIY